MPSRVFLLALVTSAFVMVWTTDSRHEQAVIAARLQRHGGPIHAQNGQTRSRALQAVSATSVFSPSDNSGIHLAAPPRPSALATGAYRLIAHDGTTTDIQVTQDDLKSLGIARVDRTPLRTEMIQSGQRWFLIRLDGANGDRPATRISIEDAGLRPVRL